MTGVKTLYALVLSVLAVAGGCGGDGTEVSAGSGTTAGEVAGSTAVTSSTTAAAVETTLPTDASSTSVVGDDAQGAAIDPEGVLDALDASRREELAKLAPIEVPTWLPQWVIDEGAQMFVVSEPDGVRPLVTLRWELAFPEAPLAVRLDSYVTIELTRYLRVEGDSESSGTGDEVAGAARSYSLSTIDCAPEEGGFSSQVLVWDEGPYRYAVDMVPLPGCAPGFTLAQAVAFADSIVTCAYEQDRFACGEPPERQGE